MPTTALNLVNQAYDKDFRWWFLALLVCVLAGGIWIMRYLVQRAERSEAAHSAHVEKLLTELASARLHHHDRMENLTAQYFKLSQEVSAVVAANTAESREVRRYLERTVHP